MGVAAEVVQHMDRRSKRFFGIDDPWFFSQGVDEELEGSTVSQGSGLTYKEELVSIKSAFEQVEELAAKDDAEGCNREQKVFAGRTPALLIVRHSSSGDQAMEMKMIQQGLVPGMQHRDKTDLSAKTRAAKINERFTDGFKEMT